MSTRPVVLVPGGVEAPEPALDSALTRLRALAARPRLVREIANGADPEADRARSLCAARLISPRTRRVLATALEHVIEAAHEPRRGMSSQVRVAGESVLEASASIHFLARRLRDDGRVRAQGVARVDQLLRNAYSPLYVDSGPGVLHSAVREATVSL